MPKHITSAVKPLRTFLSFKDFNLLKSLAPSARSFFNFMTACYFPCLHVTSFLSSKRKIPSSVDSVSTVVLREWNPQYFRNTTVNFAFNSISFLLNISVVLFDMSTWNICRWHCMLSKAVFIHSHIYLACKTPCIIRDLRSRTITVAAQSVFDL